jgi:hypothetical protein
VVGVRIVSVELDALNQAADRDGALLRSQRAGIQAVLATCCPGTDLLPIVVGVGDGAARGHHCVLRQQPFVKRLGNLACSTLAVVQSVFIGYVTYIAFDQVVLDRST